MRCHSWLAIGVCAVAFGCSNSSGGSETFQAEADAGPEAQPDTYVPEASPPAPKLTWPEPLIKITGAFQPALAITGTDRVLLATSESGKLMLRDNPSSLPMPVELGDNVGENTSTTAAGSPTDDSAVFVWEYARSAWVVDGVPSVPAKRLVSNWESGDRVHLAWTGSRPLLAMQTKGSVDILALGPPDADQVAPATEHIRPWDTTRMHYFNELNTVASLDDSHALMFSTNVYEGQKDYREHEASWTIASFDTSNEVAVWGSRSSTGYLPFPGNSEIRPSWIQAHRISDGNFFLTWTELNGTAVFDLHVAKLRVGADGTPALGDKSVNVSDTPGETDNSDYPTVLPAGDGRIWISWRERNFGPRVALYDSDLKRIAITAPDQELNTWASQPVVAAVDSHHTLYVATVVSPISVKEGHEVWMWRFEVPTLQ